MKTLDATVTISRDEYNALRAKAELFDKYVETEELSKSELIKVKKALATLQLTKAAFLKRHPGLG